MDACPQRSSIIGRFKDLYFFTNHTEHCQTCQTCLQAGEAGALVRAPGPNAAASNDGGLVQWEEEDEEAYLTHLNLTHLNLTHLSMSTLPLVDNDDNETRIFVWRRKRQAVGKIKQYCYSKLFRILT